MSYWEISKLIFECIPVIIKILKEIRAMMKDENPKEVAEKVRVEAKQKQSEFREALCRLGLKKDC